MAVCLEGSIHICEEPDRPRIMTRIGIPVLPILTIGDKGAEKEKKRLNQLQLLTNLPLGLSGSSSSTNQGPSHDARNETRDDAHNTVNISIPVRRYPLLASNNARRWLSVFLFPEI